MAGAVGLGKVGCGRVGRGGVGHGLAGTVGEARCGQVGSARRGMDGRRGKARLRGASRGGVRQRRSGVEGKVLACLGPAEQRLVGHGEAGKGMAGMDKRRSQ